MILVTTAGKVGTATAHELAAQGVETRIIARSVGKRAALQRAGIDVVDGDLAVPATIESALDGVSGVVLVSPAVPAEEINVVDAARRAEVEHIVKVTSKAAHDSPLLRRRHHAAIETALVSSGIGYTLLRNNAYMQNFLMLAPSIRRSRSFASSAGDGRIGMIDTGDVARVAAHIAAEPATHDSKTYWLSGPQSISYGDAARILTEVVGEQVTFHPLTFAEQKAAMMALGLAEPIAEMNTQALSLFADGDSGWTTDDVATVTGHPPRTFEQFVRHNASDFE